MMCYIQKLYLFSDYFHFQTIFYFLKKKIETYLVLEAHGPHCLPEKQLQPVELQFCAKSEDNLQNVPIISYKTTIFQKNYFEDISCPI